MPTAALDVQREMLLLVTARVRDAYLRRPVYVDAALDLASVCREMARLNVTSVLLRDGERLGLFTTTDLRDAVVRGMSLERVPVRDAARFELITVRPDCELFEALWLMERHRVHRLVVCEGAQVLGVLAQLDLVSFVANHSHIRQAHAALGIRFLGRARREHEGGAVRLSQLAAKRHAKRGHQVRDGRCDGLGHRAVAHG